MYEQIVRRGILPQIHEVSVNLNYRIFRDRSFIESRTILQVTEDVGMVSLHNDELIFDQEFFTHVAWQHDGQLNQKALTDYDPINAHGDILKLPDNITFIALYNPTTGIGAGSVRKPHNNNVGPMGEHLLYSAMLLMLPMEIYSTGFIRWSISWWNGHALSLYVYRKVQCIRNATITNSSPQTKCPPIEKICLLS